MNDSEVNRVFCTLTMNDICQAVANSQNRVIYAAPGIFRPQAEVLAMFGQRHPSRLRVILNPAPDICRLGYGELGAIEYLMEAGISMHKAAGLKLGVLVADDHAWIFAPTPCVIEEPAADGTTNAIAIDISEAQRLVRAISSDPEPATEAGSQRPEGVSATTVRPCSACKGISGIRPVRRIELDWCSYTTAHRPSS